MPVANATPLQRLTLRNEAVKTGVACQSFAQNGITPGTAHAAAIDAQLATLLTALSDVGATAALPATQAVVQNGGTAPVQNSAGAAIGTGTFTVAANAVSNIKLPANVAGVVSGVKVNAGAVSGSGNFATITVANGVITGIVLSAS
jgi:hypothetical protein